ncbi:MAG: GNAT family N-acetyltransferase [Erysipelotrichaceae bacterium]|nr:GNAT family N-acetyltransferase [Erysipelotrichaceae bacterium]
MKIIVRKAKNGDREDIALCIAEAFEKDFSILCKDIVTTARAISSGIVIDKFFVAELDGKIVGVLAISNCNGRAVITDRSSYKKYFGFFKGVIAKLVLKEEFESKLDYPITTGYIEFVSVKKEYKRKGIATTLIKESLKLSDFNDYVLDVTDINTSAINCYNNLGFKEFKRMKEKHGKQKGFNEKIYMRYKK